MKVICTYACQEVVSVCCLHAWAGDALQSAGVHRDIMWDVLVAAKGSITLRQGQDILSATNELFGFDNDR